MTLHLYYINIMLRDPVFCNSVRGFVAEISHFGPLQARPAARRSKRPVPRTVPAVCLPSPTHLRLPSADPRPPPAPPSASPPPAHGSGCPPVASRMPPAAARRPTSAARPAVRIAVPRTVPAVCLPSPTHLRLPCRRPCLPPMPAARAAVRIAAPAHGSGCPPRVLPVAVRVARVARSPITPRPPPDGSAFPAPASTGRPALFFWKIRNVSKIALQPYAAVI